MAHWVSLNKRKLRHSASRQTPATAAWRAVVAAATGVVVVLLCSFLLLRLSPFPELDAFTDRPRSIALQDRYGELLQLVHPEDGVQRFRVAYQDVPPCVEVLFLSAEDRRFWLHVGVDPAAILRAAVQNRRSGSVVSGASTITMQLARLVAPHSGGLSGKLSEAWNALRLETRYSKTELLELYVNNLPFGAGAEGVDSAARRFFGHGAEKVTPAEAALLAVIPRRPSALHPHRYAERTAAAALPVVRRAGLEVTREEMLAAAEAGRQRSAKRRVFESPHFVDFTMRRLSPEQLQSGKAIRTTLDLQLQHRLENQLYAGLRTAAHSRINNVAGLVLDHRSGEILAYVGSLDYFDAEHGGMIDAVHIRRQPGSTLKPFLYALALEQGFTAATILPDLPQVFGGVEAYIPQNFTRRFAGPVRLRTALASSLNIPAVYTVVRLGVANFADRLQQLGFDSVASQRNSVGAGIALGNVEVSLFELTRAFSVFARDGELLEYRLLRDGIESSAEATVSAGSSVAASRAERPRSPGEPSAQLGFDRAVAQIIRDILRDQADRILGFGPTSVLNTDFPTIAKTGTANQFSNIWALVSDPDYTVGIWMGNIHGETVIGRTGSSLPAQAAVRLLSEINNPDSSFSPLDAVHTVRISPVSGMRYNPPEGGSIPELFQPGEYPPPDTWHSAGGAIRYPAEYQHWAESYRLEKRTAKSGEAAAATRLQILSPNDGARFYRDPYISDEHQSVGVAVVSDGDELIQLFWNGSLAAEGLSPLHWRLPIVPGTHNLQAQAAGLRQEVTVSVGN